MAPSKSELESRLSIKKLSDNEIFLLFSLKKDESPDAWKLTQEDVAEVPSRLETFLGIFDHNTCPHHGASDRRVLHILNWSLIEEKKANPQRPTSLVKKLKDTVLGGSSNEEEKEDPCKLLSMRCKTLLSYEIKYLGQKKMAHVLSEYSFWYTGSEKMGPGIVVTITFKEHRRKEGLAYMAMVHNVRKRAGKDAAVYGIFSDGHNFTFAQISNNSKFSESIQMLWKLDKVRIITHIRLFLRKTIQMTPTKPQKKPSVAAGPDYLFSGQNLTDSEGRSTEEYRDSYVEAMDFASAVPMGGIFFE